MRRWPDRDRGRALMERARSRRGRRVLVCRDRVRLRVDVLQSAVGAHHGLAGALGAAGVGVRLSAAAAAGVGVRLMRRLPA